LTTAWNGSKQRFSTTSESTSMKLVAPLRYSAHIFGSRGS
jgi:hypothetical protein